MFDLAVKKEKMDENREKEGGERVGRASKWTKEAGQHIRKKKRSQKKKKERKKWSDSLFSCVCKLIRLLHRLPPPPSLCYVLAFSQGHTGLCCWLWAASLSISSDDDPWSICTQRLLFDFFSWYFFSFYYDLPRPTESFRALLTAPQLKPGEKAKGEEKKR